VLPVYGVIKNNNNNNHKMVDMPSRRLVKSPTAKSNRRSLSNLLGALTIVVVGDFTVGDTAKAVASWSSLTSGRNKPVSHGRLNQWAHWACAQGPGFFSL